MCLEGSLFLGIVATMLATVGFVTFMGSKKLLSKKLITQEVD